jgi:hypothetical protein
MPSRAAAEWEISPRRSRDPRDCGGAGDPASSARTDIETTPDARQVNRTPLQRLAIFFVMALHLSAWTGDALGVHPCPHHSGLPAAVEQGAHHAGNHAHGKAPAGHGAHDVCTCVSACPSAAPALLPDAAPAFQAAVVDHHAAPASPAEALLSSTRPYILPYGQAPPA